VLGPERSDYRDGSKAVPFPKLHYAGDQRQLGLARLQALAVVGEPEPKRSRRAHGLGPLEVFAEQLRRVGLDQLKPERESTPGDGSAGHAKRFQLFGDSVEPGRGGRVAPNAELGT